MEGRGLGRGFDPLSIWEFSRLMRTVIIAFHLMIVVALVVVVLLQKSEGGALGIGGGGGFLTGRGQANVLTRATAILGGLFFLTSIALTIESNLNRAPTSILEGTGAGAAPNVPIPAGATPGKAPAAPSGDLLNQLRQIQQQRSSTAPPAPGGAQPPQP
jgi:preprotein translocase subunit SecG